MTDQNVWRLKRGQLDTALPDPDPDPLPENWQAIALTMVSEVDKVILALARLRKLVREAIEDDDYMTFRHILEYVGSEANDRPK